MENIKFKNNTLNTVIIPNRFTLKGYMVEAIYVDNKQGVIGAPCGGGHSCDRARFNIVINNVVVLEANLNNQTSENNPDGTRPPLMPDGIGSSEMDRYSANIISESIANQIADNDPINYTVNIFPHPTNTDPHKDITWVRIKDPEENIIYSSCSAAGEAVSVTENILSNLNAVKRLECLDKVNLDFEITNMEPGTPYSVKYRVLDIQSLNTIPLNEKTYEFSKPCCTNKLTQEYLNGFTITPSSRNLNCTVEMTLKCTQSALVEISLLKNSTTLSRDIAQIVCPVCKLDASLNQPALEKALLSNINDQFTISFTNMDAIGSPVPLFFGNNNTASIPTIISNNNSYTDTIISLLADNLTINNYYEYKFYIVLNNAQISIEPMTGRFFAGETRQTLTSMFNMSNNQISVMYASLKDLGTGIVKNTRLVYLVNTANCSELPKNFELIEYPQNTSTESGLELGDKCDIKKLLETCILPQ